MTLMGEDPRIRAARSVFNQSKGAIGIHRVGSYRGHPSDQMPILHHTLVHCSPMSLSVKRHTAQGGNRACWMSGNILENRATTQEAIRSGHILDCAWHSL